MKSELCLCDTDGTVEVLMVHEGHIEAPNWHPDGYLVVNGGGRLFRVPLDAPALEEIDTGHAVECNNDHGISPDGTQLALSDKSRTAESCIYTLPIAGGTPVRITADVPSWWHGWSPDGARMTYVGARGDRLVKLFTCAATGGDEVLVCDAFDHIDGPDYAHDGAWIWFNGERDGQVDILKIRPDGRDLTRMTHGESVDWFPHPAPDGRHVVWLAYPPGTEGHPADREVALRIMAPDGSDQRELTRFRGGQGTINVPSWAPDGTRFAFMRYG